MRFFITLGVLLIVSCSSEKRTEKPVSPKITAWEPVRDPLEFKDIVLNSFLKNDIRMLDSVRYWHAELSKDFEVSESYLKDPANRLRYDSFLTRVATVVQLRDEESFENMLREGRKKGIDWTDPKALTKLHPISHDLHPAYKIEVEYEAMRKKYVLSMQTDSLNKGFVLGGPISLEEKP